MSASAPIRPQLPNFKNDQEMDTWLRHHSLRFRTMARRADLTGGYKIENSKDVPQGLVTHDENGRHILLNPALKGSLRTSIFIFEITNAYQAQAHQRIDSDTREHKILTHQEFGRRHELIEYNGLVLHRAVLRQLAAKVPIDAPWLTWVSPGLIDLSSSRVPLRTLYLTTQIASGHTGHYYGWYYRQRGETVPAGI